MQGKKEADHENRHSDCAGSGAGAGHTGGGARGNPPGGVGTVR